ncbi:MAG TPA: class I SAM-dependent methyltransferase [Rhizomicrobium sp.]|jgi:SAM-dependent methyltransferase|nr:class I SAM-dependent methyltransferase [Rhizomicrobium sp.]
MSSANAQQVEYWNGPVGERWASLQESIDLHLAEITEALIGFAVPRAGERVLDVGCGCGTTTFLLAMNTEPEGSAAGIDISAPMLRVARARAMAQNADVVFLEGDAATYEFQPVFDLVFSRFGIMFFADPVGAFANLRDGLAPGGRVVFACWRRFEENLWAWEPMQAALPLLPPQEAGDPLAPGPFAFADGARLRRLLTNAGFTNIAIESFDGNANMGATVTEAAAQALKFGPLSRAATGLDEEIRAKIRRVVEGVYARYQTPSGVVPPAACWFVRARS